MSQRSVNIAMGEDDAECLLVKIRDMKCGTYEEQNACLFWDACHEVNGKLLPYNFCSRWMASFVCVVDVPEYVE